MKSKMDAAKIIEQAEGKLKDILISPAFHDYYTLTDEKLILECIDKMEEVSYKLGLPTSDINIEEATFRLLN